MNWTGHSIILSTRSCGEHAAIIGVLSPEHGRYHGVVRHAASKAARGIWQPGNIVAVRWSARLSEQLGSFTGELVEPLAFHIMQDALTLAALNSACALMETALPEREAIPHLYDDLETLLLAIKEEKTWLPLYVKLELALLAASGFGLDLSQCAATGTKEALRYVSPKSGRAVCEAAGAPYRERLFRLPDFLQENTPQTGINPREILDGMTLTGYFLERWLLAPHGAKMPAARVRFEERVKRSCLPLPQAGEGGVVREQSIV